MCNREKYTLISDFAWYISILLDLAVMQGSQHGKDVADSLIDISIRVDTVRPYAVEAMLTLLLNETLILGKARETVAEVLKAAAWIVGEYSSILNNISNDKATDRDIELDENNGYWIEGPLGEDIRSYYRGQALFTLVMNALLHPHTINLPPHVQITYIQAAMKVFLRGCSLRDETEISLLVGSLRKNLGLFLQVSSVWNICAWMLIFVFRVNTLKFKNVLQLYVIYCLNLISYR